MTFDWTSQASGLAIVIVISISTLCLRRCLLVAINLRNLYPGPSEKLASAPDKGSVNIESSWFEALKADSGELISTADLVGDESILLFVSVADRDSPLYSQLNTSVAWLRRKSDGHLYVVCNGSLDGCREIGANLQRTDSLEERVPMLIDEEGEISASFAIEQTPSAVMLDKNARIVKRGINRQASAKHVH